MATQYLQSMFNTFSTDMHFLTTKNCAVESNKILFLPSYLLQIVQLFKETVIIVLLLFTFSCRTL